MIKNKYLAFLTLVFFIYNTSSISLENKILVKIEDQIITSLDVINEYNYLVAMNPSIKNSKKEDILKFSKRSIMQERIKKIEIENNFNNPKIPQKIQDQILKNIYSKIGFTNLYDFKEYLDNNDINFENVKNKLAIEALWNELILIKFSSKVKINKKKLRDKIENNNNKFLKSLLLSEIYFEIKNINELDNKFMEISQVIKNKGFDFAALEYSLSTTSNFGGKLDWINESSLNKNIIAAISNLEINEFTKPIVVPGGFLILKINEIKNTKIKIDVEKEFKKLEDFEKNYQLNQYSKIYFNRIKKDLKISEL
ncbi:peptidylprolyl isomerase [Candidatus Pelagibacter bacterium nBUS_29]|uniref:peptidylprolyl isomerase n=1 Tax=Candidatus Pelagibacter bacterium nBUS_29 TaxID=3374190 RepID=UPI003EBF225C